MAEISFSCRPGCGRCCHGHNLPLTMAEAVQWTEAGGEVMILCEASAWPAAPAVENEEAAHRRRRSFAAVSGIAPIRVEVTVTAINAGPCRFLDTGRMVCSVYERRPLVCRVFPAEINPLLLVNPTSKACPGEAWQGQAVFALDGRPVDPVVMADIRRWRHSDQEDAGRKAWLCRLLGIDVAGLKGETATSWRFSATTLLSALRPASTAEPGVAGGGVWQMHVLQAADAAALAANGVAATCTGPFSGRYELLSLNNRPG